jgi:hypothetical protein
MRSGSIIKARVVSPHNLNLNLPPASLKIRIEIKIKIKKKEMNRKADNGACKTPAFMHIVAA